MPGLLAVVTRKGQVTIPAEIREALNLQRGDVVEFTLPDSPKGATTVRRAQAARTSVVEQLFGSLRSDVPMLTPEQEKAAFEEAVAQDAEPLPSRYERASDHG
jgi:antitoxin PrlF